MSETATMSGPNASSTAPAQNAVLSDADIFAKMTAMRNQVQETAEAAAPGSEKSAPVAPQGTEVIDDNTESIEPEVGRSHRRSHRRTESRIWRQFESRRVPNNVGAVGGRKI